MKRNNIVPFVALFLAAACDFSPPEKAAPLSESFQTVLAPAAVTVADSGEEEECKVTKGVFRPDPATCLLYTSPSPRDATLSRMPSSA